MLVCTEPEPRVVDGVRIVPWKVFLEELWHGGKASYRRVNRARLAH